MVVLPILAGLVFSLVLYLSSSLLSNFSCSFQHLDSSFEYFFIHFLCLFSRGRVRLRQCSAGNALTGFASTFDVLPFLRRVHATQLAAGRLSERSALQLADPACPGPEGDNAI